MKTKISILLVLVIIYASAFAQAPILTYADTGPVPGDVFVKFNADTAGVMNGTPGANQTWNYSSLSMNGTQTTYNYVSPASAPNAASFPAATVVFSTGSVYSYQNVSLSDITILGTGTSSYALVYSDPEILFTFPFTFQENITDSVKGSYTIGSFTFNRKGVRITNADGWGTLILPSGIHHNMLRVKIIQDYTDIKSTGGTTHVYNVTYDWYDGIHKNAALEILNSKNITSTGTLTDRFVMVSSDFAGISEQESAHKRISFETENPVYDHITFNIEGEGSAFVQIADLSGQIVAGNSYYGNNSQINVSALPAGIYIIKATTGNENVVKKFVKL